MSINIEDMSTFELSRWYALVEAINLIADECVQRGKNFNKIKISPLDIEKYIENTCDIYARKIEEEEELLQSRLPFTTSQTSILQEA